MGIKAGMEACLIFKKDNDTGAWMAYLTFWIDNDTGAWTAYFILYYILFQV